MLSWIREKFGTVVIGGIISFIAFVFIFYGIFSPKSTQGLHEGAVAGMVNGDAVTLTDFNREFNRRLEMFKGFSGGKLTEEQIEQYRIKDMVFDDLVRRRLLIQEVKKQGVQAADEQVKDAIREMSVFQKDKKFDILTYKQVLEANQYTPGRFETIVRDDLSSQLWERYFFKRVSASLEELKKEYVQTQDKRKLKYVLLSTAATKKLVHVSPAEVQKYLSEEAKLNLVKSQYEAKKESDYKGKTLDAVKESIAQELISGDRMSEAQKAGDELAEKIRALLVASKKSDTQISALLKPIGGEIKTSDWMTRENTYLPGLGDVGSIAKDAFSKSGLTTEAKKYSLAVGTVVALVVETQTPDFSKFEEQRETLAKQVLMRKQRDLYQNWISELTKAAKIEKNATVLGLEKS